MAESEFACTENAQAIQFLKLAAAELDHRTKKREDKGVEGTHEK
ncbi:MAG: hypothetical protein QGH15_20135 [Kiritimatiellia bacterium]|jgi:hypothetical protein|nr:hypothetical protein [Kiritimatiellia bacterium]